MSSTLNPSRSKLFLVSLALCFALALAAVAGLNWFIDPAGLFSRKNYEYNIAEILLSGKNVAHPGNFDERLLQKRRAELETASSIDHLVMGSSRALLIDRHLLPGLRNIAVSGAVLQDHVALWELWRVHQPRTVWLVLDPWLFNRNSEQQQWQSLEAEYRAGLVRLGRQGATSLPAREGLAGRKLHQLFNWEYTRASWQRLIGKSQSGSFAVVAEDLPGDSDVIASAGNRIPDLRTLQRGVDEVDRLADEFARKPSYLFKNFNASDEGFRQQFESLLADMKKQSCVVLVFAPVHPLVHASYARSTPPFARAESDLREIATRLGLPAYGSFSAANAGCSAADFYDGIHPMPTCIRSLVRTADACSAANSGR